MVDVFGILPRFFENFLESENLVCSTTEGTKTALGIAFGSMISRHPFSTTHFSRRG